MRVLVTWATTHGATAEIGGWIADTLRSRGYDAVAAPCETAPDPGGFDAVVVGGALYANRWPAPARRFVRRHVRALRRVPVWFFSSGPLDDSAATGDLAATTEVAVLAERVGALGHATFGGRLAPDVRGFPARAIAREHAGDWRDPARVRRWADSVADALPAARPGPALDHPAASPVRLLGHGLVAWGASAGLLTALLFTAGKVAALAIHGVAAPAIYGAVAWRYFGARGARPPLVTALAWTGLALALNLVVALDVLGSFVLWRSMVAHWLPLALAFLVTWTVGGLRATMPWPTAAERPG